MVHLHSPISVYFYGTVETLLVDTWWVSDTCSIINTYQSAHSRHLSTP